MEEEYLQLLFQGGLFPPCSAIASHFQWERLAQRLAQTTQPHKRKMLLAFQKQHEDRIQVAQEHQAIHKRMRELESHLGLSPFHPSWFWTTM